MKNRTQDKGTGPDTLVEMGPGQEARIKDVQIPDLRDLAMWLKDSDGVRTKDQTDRLMAALDTHLKAFGQAVLDTWHIAHALKKHIMGVK